MYERPRMRLPQEIDQMTDNFRGMNATPSATFEGEQLLSKDVQASADIFSNAISTDAPLFMFSRSNHQAPIPSKTNTAGKPVQTNKFFGNMLLGDQTLPVWTHPYSVWFSKDVGYEGLSMHQVPASDRVFGPDGANPSQYFFGPTGIKSIVLGSTDFDAGVTLGLENIMHMSTDCKIYSASQGYLLSPLVQGQAFITGIYFNLIPQLKSIVGFASVTGDTSPRSGINKYKIKLNNNRAWTLYITIPSGQSLNLALKDNNTIVGDQAVNGAVFQVVAGDDLVFDKAAGMYPTRGTLSGSVSGNTGSYSISYSTAGSSNNGTTAMFALPHQVSTFTSGMNSSKTDVTFDTVTKGAATCYLTNKFDFQLSVPANIGLDPYSSISGIKGASWSDNVKNSIRAAASVEINGDVQNESNTDSMYGSGKILAKYAWLLYVTHYVLQDRGMTQTLLPKVKAAIERFSKNTQQFPLTYDQTWKGLISTASGSADYGNSYYNDHHFHYGYHVMAAAITARVDKDLGGSWVTSIQSWVNDMTRDFATPNDSDQYFPAFRCFDWYNGHSWAKGIFVSGDGKDQESSSEDYNAYYGVKIWASVIGDSAMEQRANLQLGILNKSCNSYFLMANNNSIQPANFIRNKVTGILFENKCDHTTYFGTNLEYIQMIHAIPITSLSSFVRNQTFTQEEWNEKLSDIVNNVNDGWKGIMMLNVAMFDPTTSYNFFNSSSFQNGYLDNGQSKSWSLTYSGAFANA